MSGNIVTGIDVRAAARSGALSGPTCGLAPGYLQANLVILPQELAPDFLLFCQQNPKPCPLIDMTEPGKWELCDVAPGSDIRTDVPLYRVYRHGLLTDEPTEITHLWRHDLVTFLLGCSFSFEAALQRAGLPVRHLEERRNVPMFRTNIPCTPAGRLRGKLVVSMRPLTPAQAIQAIVVTSAFPQAHGAPVHFGDPGAIGISDLSHPDFGDPVTIGPDEVPVFWACGVTPQVMLMELQPEFAITHSPGCMFVTDQLADDN